jgi:hypothetical protein
VKQRITQKFYDGLEPAETDLYVTDDGLIGFRLKVTPAGKKVLFFQYRTRQGQQRKITYTTRRVDEARKLARGAAAQVRDGQDPLSERDRLATMPSFERAFEMFEAEYVASECKPATAAEYHRIFHKYVAKRLGQKPAEDAVGILRLVRGRRPANDPGLEPHAGHHAPSRCEAEIRFRGRPVAALRASARGR